MRWKLAGSTGDDARDRTGRERLMESCLRLVRKEYVERSAAGMDRPVVFLFDLFDENGHAAASLFMAEAELDAWIESHYLGGVAPDSTPVLAHAMSRADAEEFCRQALPYIRNLFETPGANDELPAICVSFGGATAFRIPIERTAE